MIYSAAFGALPADVRRAIYARMSDVLAGRDTSPKYARLTGADRRVVVEILRDTLPDFPQSSRGRSAKAFALLRSLPNSSWRSFCSSGDLAAYLSINVE